MSAIGRFCSVTPAVFETDADPVVVSAHCIIQLIAAAQQAPAGRARLILHTDREDTLHEMVIALPPDSCDHPHINFKSGKSFLALSGQFAVMVFSDDGTDIRPIVLSADSRWPGARLARLRRPAWHTIIPLSGDTVFLETIVGPFRGNRFASWFPDATGAEERKAWSEKLRTLAIDAAEGSVST
jgi:cupin fold WbuC family metalloprotein